MASSTVLHSYRTVIRTINRVFRGDTLALTEGKNLARAQYLENSHVTDPEELKRLVAMAQEACDFLRNNVLQAALNDAGNYEVTMPNQKETVLQQPDTKAL